MLIESKRDLVIFCNDIADAPALFLDTEFVGEGRYYPDIGAIQVGTPDVAALVDPIAIPDLSPLLELLANENTIKVFHAANQDLAIFYRLMGRAMRPIWDTQLAAALLGSDEQIAFVNLVERLTGKRLRKEHSFTNWLQRPLAAGQVEYALDDVRYLIPVYEEQRRQMEELGRLDWATEEFARLERDETWAPADPTTLYLRIRNVDRLNGRTLAILRELVAWREDTARNDNIPAGRIARDEVLVELARRPPPDARHLRDIRGLTAQQADRYGRQMIEAVVEGGRAAPPPAPTRQSFPSAMEPTVDFLFVCLRSLAVEKSVATGMVATRGDMSQLAVRGEEADIALMRGWRRKAFGDDLLATLEGKATARIIPETREVHLEWRRD
ncbi:MAG TPA: ribonuclease D [Armatimonadota bacterium]|jgi:ribonuclease D